MLIVVNPVVDALLLVSFSFILLYLYARYHYGYWKRRGIYSPPATFPGGHFGKVLAGKEQVGVHLANLYHETKQHPFVGIFLLHSKTLLINDLDLIKAIMVKDFQHFPDHGLGMSPETDPLSNHLFNMEGSVWKALRNKLTPTFTSSKMKYMFDTMLQCCKEMENYIDDQVKSGKDVDFRETMARFGTDVIGSCAFGITTNSFKHPDAEFRQMGKKSVGTNFFKGIRDIMSLYAPSLVKRFNIRLIYKDVEEFFTNTIRESVEYREKNKVSRNDFLQILIDMKKKDEESGNGQSLSLIEMAAQVFLFFIAGFETSSTTISFALYELAKNPEIQNKLREEIDRVTEKHGGKITYESISEMEYLGQVIEESLRMYPPLPFLFRVCAKDYTFPGTNTVVEKGTRILIPIFGFQRDPKVHENPTEFRPERFSPENKTKLHPFASIPFGEGPRICIGNRFGLMQSRLGLISALSKFEVSLKGEVKDDVKFESQIFILTPTENQLFQVVRRKDKFLEKKIN